MKKLYTFFLSLFVSCLAFGQTYDITFQVDMRGQAVSPNGVHVAGDFQSEANGTADWQPGDNQLLDADGDSIYSTTVSIPAGRYEFKFINDNDWPGVEGVPAIAQSGVNGSDNRWINVVKSDSLAPVMFGGAAPMGMIFIGLQADMREQLNLGATTDTVDSIPAMDAMGSFPMINWSAAAELLDRDGDSIFTGYTYGMAGNSYDMKFRRKRAWNGTEESISSALPCENSSNRAVPAMTTDSIVGPICYNKCSPCVATVLDTFQVTMQVDMSNEFIINGMGPAVSVAGNFQDEAGFAGDWSPGQITLTDADGDSVYTVDLTIVTADAVGGVYTFQYKFLNGDAWGSEEGVPAACNVGGNREAAISGDTTLAFCFASCAGSCPVLLDPIQVTFRVDLITDQIIPSGEGVHVAGTFQNPAWDKDTLEMTDPDGNGIYEINVTMRPGEYQYKFINGTQDADEEDGDFIAGGCGVSNGIGGSNRLLDITGLMNDTILPAFKYNSCDLSPIGIFEVAENKGNLFAVYPNPFSDNATIALNTSNSTAFSIQVMDLTGKVVIDVANFNQSRYILNKGTLQAGVYLLKVTDNNGAASVEKLIIE